MTRFTVKATPVKYSLSVPIRGAGICFTEVPAVVVQIETDAATVQGECAPRFYFDETTDRICRDIEAFAAGLEHLPTRIELLGMLPAGPARSAIDAALWQLEAVQKGSPVWKLAGLDAPQSLMTAFTVGVDEAGIMAEAAAAYQGARMIKLKLDGAPQDAERIRAVRERLPDIHIIVDANQGWTLGHLNDMERTLVETGVMFLEQPLPREQDSSLRELQYAVPLAADESVQDATDLASARGAFDIIVIKLDKCGGLTQALDLARDARAYGFKLMVGNMGGSSIGLAPAYLLGQICDWVDLDGPALLARDVMPAAAYRDGKVHFHAPHWTRATGAALSGTM